MKKDLSKIRMAFIVGMGRSGSTLLQHLFDSHAEIVSPIESLFVVHLRSKYVAITNWDSKTIRGFVNDLYSDRKFRLFWDVNKDDLLKHFSEFDVQTFSDACKVVYLSYSSISEKTDVKLIVDKNPGYAFLIPFLREVFPDAFFIHLIRDPRAVISSQIKSLKKKSVYALAHQWNKMNERIMHNVPERHCTLKYEDLVKEPADSLSPILSHFQLSFDPSMLTNQANIKARVRKDKSFMSHDYHHNVSNPINTQSLEKWKQILGAQDINAIEIITCRIAKSLSYDLPYGQKSLGHRINSLLGKRKMLLRRTIINVIFRLPFALRKHFFNVVSFFFDGKHKV